MIVICMNAIRLPASRYSFAFRTSYRPIWRPIWHATDVWRPITGPWNNINIVLNIVYAACSATPRAPLIRIKILKADHSKHNINANGIPFYKYSITFCVHSQVGILITYRVSTKKRGYRLSPENMNDCVKPTEMPMPLRPRCWRMTKCSVRVT